MKSYPLFADILIVDDEPDFVRPVRLVLQAAGYIVRSVDSGEAALEAAQSRPPDLILLDATLPEMDGYEVARSLKADANLPFIPIIMVTARHTGEDIAAALNAGADEFIGKPVENAELLTRVRAMLRLKATTDALADLEETTRHLFMTYMPQQVAEMLISDPGRARPGGARCEVTIMFADLEGFTPLAENLPPEQVLNALNVYLSIITSEIIAHGGTVDKFMGDGVMAIFNAPLELTDHAYHALQAVLNIQRRTRHIVQENFPAPMHVNIGLHTGQAVVGNVGGSHLLNYTAIGDAVNLAKRLQEMAHEGQILISEEMLALLRGRAKIQFLGQRMVKGRRSPVRAYMVSNEVHP